MNGRIRQEDIDEIRRRATLPEVAADYMQLRRAGRRFKALCPFHSEKTPSFSIDPGQGLWYCFGCNRGGDVIKLVRELDSLSFVEAVEKLAQRTGVTLEYERLSASDRAAMTRRGRLVDAHRAALEFFRRSLFEGEAGAAARDYLKGRGFRRATVEAFGVGFAPGGWDELSKHLLRSGFREADLVEAGLASRSERGTLVDRFRGRVVFPIFDITGNPVGFGARRLGEGDGPKYVNSSESPIYAKGKILYALNFAKADIARTGRALVVEGYTDVMALHQAGVSEAVATCGTALGAPHMALLHRFTERVVISLDSDEAGRAAAEKAFELAQEARIDARMLVLPDGQDPADFLAVRPGDDLRALVEVAVPIVEHRLRRAIAPFDLTEPEQQSRALRAAIPILAAVGDDVMRTEYVSRLAGWLRVSDAVAASHVEVARAGGKVNLRSDSPRIAPQVRAEREAIKIALQYPADAAPYLATLRAADFSSATHRTIWAEVEAGARPAAAIVDAVGDERAAEAARALAMEPPEGVEEGAPEVSENLIEQIFTRVKEFALDRQIHQAKQVLQRLNPETSADEYRERFRALMELEGTRRRMSTVLMGGDDA